jgi:hypothetical protein
MLFVGKIILSNGEGEGEGKGEMKGIMRRSLHLKCRKEN